MIETQINNKEIVFETEVCKNSDEVKFEADFGINDFDCSHIFIPENCRKDSRKRLTDSVIQEIQNEIVETKSKNKDKIVIGFFQTKKNTIKSIDRIENQISCSSFDGSDGVCIYETNIQQEPDNGENTFSQAAQGIGLYS